MTIVSGKQSKNISHKIFFLMFKGLEINTHKSLENRALSHKTK